MYAKKNISIKNITIFSFIKLYQAEYNLGSICNLNKILLSLYLFLIYQLLNWNRKGWWKMVGMLCNHCCEKYGI